MLLTIFQYLGRALTVLEMIQTPSTIDDDSRIEGPSLTDLCRPQETYMMPLMRIGNDARKQASS